MTTNSTGFALSAGMAAIVVLLGYTLLTAVSLVRLAADPAFATLDNTPSCGVPPGSYLAPPTTAELLNLTPAEAAVIDAGNTLFKANCAQCHALNDKIVGPALTGISQRRPLPWIVKWVKNSTKVVASGDAYAVKLFNEYQKQQMPSFDLSDQQITAVVRYIDAQQARPLQY